MNMVLGFSDSICSADVVSPIWWRRRVGWFSCLKQVLLSLSLCCMTMYKRENSATSFFSIEIFPACFFLVLCLVCWTSKTEDFFLIGSCMECVRSITDLWLVLPAYPGIASIVPTVLTTHSSMTFSCVQHGNSGVSFRSGLLLSLVVWYKLSIFLWISSVGFVYSVPLGWTPFQTPSKVVLVPALLSSTS